MFYEIKLTQLPKGEDKPVKEHYILDALLHAEAEKRGYDLYPDRETDVTCVFRSDIKEILNEPDEDKVCFCATVCDVTTDDEGKEKLLKYKVLVWADSIDDATSVVNEHLRQGYDMRLDAIKRTKINDYLR